MPRTLLVTNDFPPRPGGIQSYLHSFASRFPEDELVVYAPRWRGDSHVKFDARQPFEVVRHPTTLMLPTPCVARRASQLVQSHSCESVWFGAAAPLAVMAPTLRRAGADTVVASTHGHEVGWSMIPGARSTLRTIGNSVDTVTYVSKYTRSRFASAFGPEAALEHVPPGVDTERFKPDAGARAELRARYGLGDRPTVLCLSRLVPRKGQDVLIRSLTGIRKRIDGAVLVIVGGGPYEKTLRELARRSGVEEHVVFTGTVPSAELAAHHTIA
ncbi:MAG: glycosyltransferase family 4 protein, partial [Rhodococcus sp. (in: high G+C Gram-positive bacteria)]